MKKLVLAVLLMLSAVAFSGCTTKLPEGYDAVKQAKDQYEQLDSAHVTMTDLTDGSVIMDFSFYINPNNEMVLSYYGIDGEEEQFAYSNGAEYFYKEHGDEKWTVIGSDDENYLYNLYNREYRYPYAQGGIFFLDGGSVADVGIINSDDGAMQITYTYDANKLNSSAVEYLDGVSGFVSLETVFTVNSDGYITEFIERGIVTGDDGIDLDINMSITVDSMNEVYDIKYPVDEIYAPGEKSTE